mmetsp:Transcript_14587/g.14209  ORF Transcript_14587/g.14209 Transcript_14587/m.14209 type:complete len:290 (-) Transcript_14587:28-897(-)
MDRHFPSFLGVFAVFDGFPGVLLDLQVAESVEDAVAPDHDEVVHLLLQVERRDLRLRDHHTRLPPILLELGFDVSEGPGDAEPPGEHPEGPQQHLLPHNIRRRPHHVRRRDALERLRLIDLPSVGKDPLFFLVFVGAVVPGEHEQLLPPLRRHDRPRISHVRHIAAALHNQNYYGAGAGLLMSLSLLSELRELLLRQKTPIGQSLWGVRREAILVYYYLMEGVFEVVGAGVASVAVVDGEVGALGPVRQVLLGVGPGHIQNNRHPIFIIIPLDALVGVGGVGDDVSVGF